MRKLSHPPLAAIALLSAFALPASAEPPASAKPTTELNDADALRGVRTGKGVFLLNLAEPEKMSRYLRLILESSHRGMTQQNVKPDFVLVFIGPGVRFLSTQPDKGLVEKHDKALKEIAESVRKLKAAGVKLEVCSVANEVYGVANDQVLPEVKVVRDGFVSVIGYQAKGYALVPVF